MPLFAGRECRGWDYTPQEWLWNRLCKRFDELASGVATQVAAPGRECQRMVVVSEGKHRECETPSSAYQTSVCRVSMATVLILGLCATSARPWVPTKDRGELLRYTVTITMRAKLEMLRAQCTCCKN